MQRFFKFMGMFMVTYVFSTLMRAWVLLQFWGWFIRPRFSEMYLSFVEALGFMLIFGLVLQNVKVIMSKPQARSSQAEYLLEDLDGPLQARVRKLLTVHTTEVATLQFKDAISTLITEPLVFLATGWCLHRFFM